MTRAVWTRANALRIFVILQFFDLLTTLLFMSKGVQEGNPLLSWVLPYAHAPWIGLVVAKLLAALIGFGCYRYGRITALRLANVGYLLIVGWNLTAIAVVAITA